MTAGKFASPVCNLLEKACVYQTTCDKVNENIYMSFKLNDKRGNFYTFSLSPKNLKIPGEDLKHPGDFCYIPVFSHGLTGTEDSQVVIMGNIILEKYYLVYDMSPLEQNKDYIQVSLAFKNPKNIIRD